MDRVIIVSADGHASMPSKLWPEYLEREYHELLPRLTAENELATTYIIGRVGNGDYGVALAYCTVLIVLMSAATALIQLVVGERELGRRIGE